MPWYCVTNGASRRVISPADLGAGNARAMCVWCFDRWLNVLGHSLIRYVFDTLEDIADELGR